MEGASKRGNGRHTRQVSLHFAASAFAFTKHLKLRVKHVDINPQRALTWQLSHEIRESQ